MNVKRKENGMFAVGCLLAVIYVFLFGNYDCEAITKWGYDLLECIRQQNSSGFPEYTYEAFGSPTNYSLSVNTMTALWLSPLYLLDKLAGWELPMLCYEKWYKLLTGVLIFADVKLFAVLSERIGIGEKRKSCALFLLSFVTLLASLGKGQVDVCGLLAAMGGLYFLIEKKYKKMALCFGLALLVKPTILFLLVPLYLLLLSRWGIKLAAYAALTALPWAADKLVTILWMPGYLALSKKTFPLLAEALGGLTITEQLFELQVNSVLVFVSAALMLCFYCYYLGMHKSVRTAHFYVLPPLLLITFGVFVCASYHWFLYILPLLIWMGERLEKHSDFYLLFLGMNLGLGMYFLTAESMKVQPLFAKNEVVLQYGGDWGRYLLTTGKTLFYVCMVLIILVFAAESWRKENRIPVTVREQQNDAGDSAREDCQRQEAVYEKILFFLQPVPAVLYLVLAFMTYWNG